MRHAHAHVHVHVHVHVRVHVRVHVHVHVHVHVWLQVRLGRVTGELDAGHQPLAQRCEDQHRHGRPRAGDGLQDLARVRARDAQFGLQQVAGGAGTE